LASRDPDHRRASAPVRIRRDWQASRAEKVIIWREIAGRAVDPERRGLDGKSRSAWLRLRGVA